VGAIFVLLDNIFVFGTDRDTVMKCLQHIRGNCRECGVWEKAASEQTLPGVVALSLDQEEVVLECFGIEFSGKGFRVAAKTFDSFEATFNDATLTRRDASSRQGKLAWFLRARGESFLEHEWFHELYSVINPRAGEGWDSLFTPQSLGTRWPELREKWVRLGERAKTDRSWVCFPQFKPQQAAFFVSDVAGEGLGCVVRFKQYASGLELAAQDAVQIVRRDTATTNIAIHELRTFRVGIEACSNAKDFFYKDIVVGGIDNRVAQAWIACMWSDLAEARHELRLIRDALQKPHRSGKDYPRRLIVVRVPTGDIYADIPTRWAARTAEAWDGKPRLPDEKHRFAATTRALLSGQEYGVLATMESGKRQYQVDPAVGEQRQREE
jgi:hypothetical protein